MWVCFSDLFQNHALNEAKWDVRKLSRLGSVVFIGVQPRNLGGGAEVSLPDSRCSQISEKKRNFFCV